jgi:hypothetical protein
VINEFGIIIGERKEKRIYEKYGYDVVMDNIETFIVYYGWLYFIDSEFMVKR